MISKRTPRQEEWRQRDKAVRDALKRQDYAYVSGSTMGADSIPMGTRVQVVHVKRDFASIRDPRGRTWDYPIRHLKAAP